MNLKQILTPKTCEVCAFLGFDEFDMPYCNLGMWSWDLVDHRDERDYVNGGFDYKNLIHKDCPLPRIKCYNCKHGELWKSEGVSYVHCHKTGGIDSVYPCIEFEEVK